MCLIELERQIADTNERVLMRRNGNWNLLFLPRKMGFHALGLRFIRKQKQTAENGNSSTI
jgi:hypothetical protein